MTYVVSTAQMKNAENMAEKAGTSLAALMQNAARCSFRFIEERFGGVKGKRFALLCGSGNNGGDGVELAAILKSHGGNATVIFTGKAPDTKVAADCAERRREAGVEDAPFLFYDGGEEKAKKLIQNAHFIIDCVFGTGFHGELPEKISELFARINRRRKQSRISLDIPSGINGDSGYVCKNAFRPNITLVLGAMKTGLFNHPANDVCGEIKVLDIGISDRCYTRADGIVTPPAVKKFIPRRLRNSNKGSFGKLLNIAGSEKYIGAAQLSSKAALRTGAGYVTLASAEKVISYIASAVPECLFVPLKCAAHGGMDKSEAAKAANLTASATAVTIGCGMSDTEDTREIVRAVLKTGKCPVVIDADGINCLKDNIYELKDYGRPIILTPHPGEFARLLKISAAEVQAGRIKLAKELSAATGAVILLKGVNTVIASPDGRTAVNPTGNPALAKAGTGDVLTGMIGALCAEGVEPFAAAVLGAYLHGQSADELVTRMAPSSVTASDVADNLGKVMFDGQI